MTITKNNQRGRFILLMIIGLFFFPNSNVFSAVTTTKTSTIGLSTLKVPPKILSVCKDGVHLCRPNGVRELPVWLKGVTFAPYGYAGSPLDGQNHFDDQSVHSLIGYANMLGANIVFVEANGTTTKPTKAFYDLTVSQQLLVAEIYKLPKIGEYALADTTTIPVPYIPHLDLTNPTVIENILRAYRSHIEGIVNISRQSNNNAIHAINLSTFEWDPRNPQQHQGLLSLVAQMAAIAKQLDPKSLVALVFSDVYYLQNDVRDVDVNIIQARRGPLGTFFDEYKRLSSKPVVVDIAEDAYNFNWTNNQGAEDEASQAASLTNQIMEIQAHAADIGGVAVNGLSDQHYLNRPESPVVSHEPVGTHPLDVTPTFGMYSKGGGSYPDGVFYPARSGLIAFMPPDGEGFHLRQAFYAIQGLYTQTLATNFFTASCEQKAAEAQLAGTAHVPCTVSFDNAVYIGNTPGHKIAVMDLKPWTPEGILAMAVMDIGNDLSLLQEAVEENPAYAGAQPALNAVLTGEQALPPIIDIDSDLFFGADPDLAPNEGLKDMEFINGGIKNGEGNLELIGLVLGPGIGLDPAPGIIIPDLRLDPVVFPIPDPDRPFVGCVGSLSLCNPAPAQPPLCSVMEEFYMFKSPAGNNLDEDLGVLRAAAELNNRSSGCGFWTFLRRNFDYKSGIMKLPTSWNEDTRVGGAVVIKLFGNE